jgi:hypothetical protein
VTIDKEQIKKEIQAREMNLPQFTIPENLKI